MSPGNVYSFPPKNAHDPAQTAMATFQHEDPQPCVATYATWQGKPVDPSDQWQCPSGVSGSGITPVEIFFLK